MAWRLIAGFLAGLLATLLFHQLTLALLWRLGLTTFGPFPMRATWPFGIPAVWSLAFWGGIWGILFALAERRFPHNAYWASAFIFGALLPSLVAFVVVLPLKRQPVGGGWNLNRLLTAFLINGAWGVGTGLILKVLSGRFGVPRELHESSHQG
jgi:hypothetical protein